MNEGTVVIRKGREKPVKNQHPWIFSGAIAHAENATPGGIVTIKSQDGAFLARGYWNQKSQIQARILTWTDESINQDWWRRMLQRAIESRTYYNERQRSQLNPYGYRLVNAENDYLPGLILDRYGDYVVLQALTLHIDQNKEMIATILADLLQEMGMSIKGVYERSDVDVREKEGLKLERGPLWGKEPPQHIPMSQEELIRLVDVRNGHKTGYYLDQLENQEYLALFMDLLDLSEPSVRLLNLFSYTGGFGLATRAYVVNVDASQQVLQLAEQNYDLIHFPKKRVEFVQADAFDYLHRCVNEQIEFDVIVLDPPKFAHSKQQVDRAARGYKDLNLNAFRIIKPGGYMMTFSCSGAIDPDLFQKIVFGALADSGRQAQIVRQLGPSDDHPVALTFPEGAYLKGLLLRVF